MNIELLKKLSDATGIGHLTEATDIAAEELSKYADVQKFGSIGLIARIDKGKTRTIMIEAHIDEVGFIVTHVFDDGFVKVAKVGGNDGRILSATPVVVHAAEELSAVFASNPPHLNGENEVKNAEDALLDTGLGKKAKDLISAGDYVTYDKRLVCLAGNRVCGKSLDDRAGVLCLIELARRLYDKELDANLVLCLSEQEELGTRGAKTAAFSINCDEAIAIDVSFADAPDVPATKCGKLSLGAMIGISPILNRKITDKLKSVAKAKEIPHQFEVMGGTTGTDADVISVARDGIPCGLLSIPLRNMHTPAEIVDTADIESVCDILTEYILCGGAL